MSKLPPTMRCGRPISPPRTGSSRFGAVRSRRRPRSTCSGAIDSAASRARAVALASADAGAAGIEFDAWRLVHRAAKTAGDYAAALAAHERMFELDESIRAPRR